MLLIKWFRMGRLAGSYSGANDPKTIVGRMNDSSDDDFRIRRRPSVIGVAIAAAYLFVTTSLEQLPNFPTVISWHFSNRLWLPMLIVVLEVLALAGGFGLKSLEKHLAQPYKRRR